MPLNPDSLRRENPWRYLDRRNPFVLPRDRGPVEAYNQGHIHGSARTRLVPDPEKIRLEIPPNPWVGSPLTARIVVLTKSPSWDDEATAEYGGDPAYAEAMWQSLTFGNEDFPFYCVNPAFARTGGYRWWQPYLRELIEACDEKTGGDGLRCVAQGVFSAAFFPYHVNQFQGGTDPLRCQSFTRNMVSRLRDEGLPIVVTGGWPEWTGELTKLKTAAHKTRNAQRAYLTKGNLPGVFDTLVERLTA